MMRLDTPNHNVLPVLSVTGVTALANAIPGMGALIKLDISSNAIGAEQEGDLQRICMEHGQQHRAR
jgi:hypothetical protein